MKKSSLFISLFLLMFSSFLYAGKYNQILSIGDQMPTFSDLPSISGKSISSKDLTQDVVVFVNLANHCPWVKGMDADLVKLVDQFSGKSVKVVGLSINLREDDRLDAMKEHAKNVGYNFAYVFDESQDLGRKLGATRTPEYYVFDKERKLAYMGLLYNSPAKMNSDGSIRHINGEVTEHYVADAIDALLNNEKLKITETRAHGCSAKYEN